MSDTDRPATLEPPASAPSETQAPLAADRLLEGPAEHPDGFMPEGEEAPPRGVRVMAIARWTLVALMALAAFAGLNQRYSWVGAASSASSTIYYCPMHPGVQQDHPGDCPICSMTLVPKPKAGDATAEQAANVAMASGDRHDHDAAASGEYYCPMHPEVTSTDPNATCEPCGGMKLQPKPTASATPSKPADGVPGLARITLSQDRIQLMGMRTAPVKRAPLRSGLRTVGTVVASEKGLAVMQTRFAGWIEDLKIEQTGQKVQKGQVLATIYSPEILAAQQEYLNALKWAQPPVAGTATDLSLGLEKDARRRLELLGISKAEIDTISRAGAPMHAIAIRSPVSGYITRKAAVQGLYVQPGAPLFEIADLSTVWVIAEVYEYEIGRVAVGQPASIEFGSYPGETFTGKLTFIHPSLSADTRTLRVRIEFKNPGLKLKPGMYGTVNIELEQAEALVVPVEAIVDTGVMQYAFVVLPGGTFEPRKLTLGTRSEGNAQVLHGLVEGERVVTTANFLLDSESHLQAAVLGDGASGTAPTPASDFCATEFDKQRFPAKHQQCVACRAHRGMGSMEDECRNQIPKPWK
jgi:Cu(I)/Ag(I) efflux system membrane fusion protein